MTKSVNNCLVMAVDAGVKALKFNSALGKWGDDLIGTAIAKTLSLFNKMAKCRQ